MIQLVPVQKQDLPMLLNWRNASKVRNNVFNHDVVSWEDHLTWFQRVKADPRSHLFIAREEGVELGFGQFKEATGKIANWGFYTQPLAPKRSGTRLCRALLKFGFEQLGFYKINGEVLGRNHRSIALHLRLGFKREGILRDNHFDNYVYQDVHCFGLLRKDYF